MKNSRSTNSLLLVLVLAIATASPVQANSFLVFNKDKVSKRTDDRSSMIWHSSTAPIPGKNCPAESTVIEIPRELKGKPIQELKRDGFIKLVHEPVVQAVPAPSEEKIADRELKQTLRDTASDTTITDMEYARLLRISNIEDPTKKLEEWEKIKDKVKKK